MKADVLSGLWNPSRALSRWRSYSVETSFHRWRTRWSYTTSRISITQLHRWSRFLRSDKMDQSYAATVMFGLKIRKCFVLVGRRHYVQLPKLAVVNSIGLSHFES